MAAQVNLLTLCGFRHLPGLPAVQGQRLFTDNMLAGRHHPYGQLCVGVGRSCHDHQVDIRVIASTNRNLEKSIVDGEFRAVRNACPHKGAPICRGIIGGTWPPSEPGELSYDRDGEVLVCPWHGYEYDLRTGTEMFQKTPTRLRLFPVTVRDGEVFVTV